MNRHRAAAGLLPIVVVSITVVGLAGQAAASGWTAESIPVGESGELLLRLPRDWASSVGGATATAPTITARPGGGRDAVLLMTAIPRGPGESLSEQELRRLVEARGNDALSTALQDRLELVRVHGPGAVGYVYHLTDRNPEAGPGDYREARQGAVLVGELVLSVTILSHAGDAESVGEALEVLSSARHAPKPGG